MPRPEDVRLTLTGTIIQEEGRLMLRLDNIKPQPLSFLLLAYTNKNTNKKHTDNQIQDRLLQELETHVGKVFQVEGYWRDAEKGSSMQQLLVTRYASIAPE